MRTGTTFKEKKRGREVITILQVGACAAAAAAIVEGGGAFLTKQLPQHTLKDLEERAWVVHS
jgi:hypothetical protein